MSATNQMRNMIAQLMGSSGMTDGQRTHNKTYDSRSVCRAFLLESCPHEVLAGTRMDIGECERLHDPALKADYEHAEQRKRHFYEFQALEILRDFIDDCDRRVDYSKRKLKESQDELSEDINRLVERMHSLGEQIGTKLARAETTASSDVEVSMRLMDEVDELKDERARVEIDYKALNPNSTVQNQKLRVCEVCSAYLGIHDNDRRLADHFGGKLHLGFLQLRKRLVHLEQLTEASKEAYRRYRRGRMGSKSNDEGGSEDDDDDHDDDDVEPTISRAVKDSPPPLSSHRRLRHSPYSMSNAGYQASRSRSRSPPGRYSARRSTSRRSPPSPPPPSYQQVSYNRRRPQPTSATSSTTLDDRRMTSLHNPNSHHQHNHKYDQDSTIPRLAPIVYPSEGSYTAPPPAPSNGAMADCVTPTLDEACFVPDVVPPTESPPSPDEASDDDTI